MKNKKWNLIRKFYLDTFGISPYLVDLLADNDILIMCASGSSNKNISISTNIDKKAIRRVIRCVFNFDGWRMDLEINPLKIYTDLRLFSNKSGYSLLKDFRSSILSLTDHFDLYINTKDIPTMFRICKLYEKIDNKLEKEWI